MSNKQNGIVAAGNELTAQSAAEVLADGGNAYDALIAALITSFSSEPVLSSPGGGGFLMAAPVGRDPALLDFFVQTPRQKPDVENLDFHEIHAQFGTTEQAFHIGLGSVATPGMIAGLFEIHERFATRPMSVLAEQGVKLSRQGHPIDQVQSDILNVVVPIYHTDPDVRNYFASPSDPDTVLKPGEDLRLPEMGDFLEVLAIEGPNLFYRGEIAQSIARQQQDGGCLTLDDLKRFEVKTRKPFTRTIAGARLSSNPPPAAGGTLIALALSLMDELRDDISSTSSAAWARQLMQVMQAVNEVRRNSGFAKTPLTSIAMELFGEELINPLVNSLKYRAQKAGGTSHISITDRKGNLASCTFSNGEGCGRMVPGAGFMLNNMLGEEDLHPDGFFEWTTDTRISSMMSPSILRWPDGQAMALGSGGSNRIRTAIQQVLGQILFFEMSLEEAVAAPRLHWEAGQLHLEAGHSEEIQAALKQDHRDLQMWPGQSFYFGGVHVAETGPRGARGAADARRGGVVKVV
jgi:gamma-glutamyltranspeptidase/glutathione hydrolase